MKRIGSRFIDCISIVACCLGFYSCPGGKIHDSPVPGDTPAKAASIDSGIADEIYRNAEIERRFGYRAGAGLAESTLHEKSGRLGEAVFSACKDIAYARSYGAIGENTMEDRLQSLAAGTDAMSAENAGQVNLAVQAIRAFNGQAWKRCVSLIPEDSIPDSYSGWMRLAAQIRLAPRDLALRSSYAEIQARFAAFPDYWYFSMLHESDPGLALDAAERCIRLAPKGPRAVEARRMIAASYKLEQKDAENVLVEQEIESIASSAIRGGNLELLRELFPVLALPDNPSTLYALGIIKGLCDDAPVRVWVKAEAEKADRRLAERLRYAGGTL